MMLSEELSLAFKNSPDNFASYVYEKCCENPHLGSHEKRATEIIRTAMKIVSTDGEKTMRDILVGMSDAPLSEVEFHRYLQERIVGMPAVVTSKRLAISIVDSWIEKRSSQAIDDDDSKGRLVAKWTKYVDVYFARNGVL